MDLGRLGCRQEGGSRVSGGGSEGSGLHVDVRNKELRKKILHKKQIEGGDVHLGACKV